MPLPHVCCKKDGVHEIFPLFVRLQRPRQCILKGSAIY